MISIPDSYPLPDSYSLHFILYCIPKETILTKLKTDEATYSKFCKLKENDKKNFLAFLSGECGLEVLLDSFFRKIFNPAEKKERMI